MYKIGVIGSRDAVLGFPAVGFAVFEAEDAETASVQLQKLVRSGDYGVIFLTEDYAVALEEQIAAYGSLPTPAIVSIPGAGGSKGYGMNHLRRAVERAVGADILDK